MGEDEDGINGIIKKTMKKEKKIVVKKVSQKIQKICVIDVI